MEPINHARYYEDVSTRSKADDDSLGTRGFDLCEDSSDDEREVAPSKQPRNDLKHSTSYGLIKRPKCEALLYADTVLCTKADAS